MELFIFLAITFMWVIVSKVIFKREITLFEMAGQMVAVGVITFVAYLLAYDSVLSDEKFVHGKVTETRPVKKSCDMSWSDWSDDFCTNHDTRRVVDRCSTNKDGKRSCTYKTQYRSIYPWERRYFVDTTIDTYEIARIDNQGSNTPPRFASVKVGDPVSKKESYTNYLLAAPQSILHDKEDDELKLDPVYIYDYWHSDQVFWDHPDAKEWASMLEQLNSDLGGVNVSLYVVEGKALEHADRIQRARQGHDINDIAIVVNLRGGEVEWADVRSWSKEDYINVLLRDRIVEGKKLSKDEFFSLLSKEVPLHYQARTMEDFEYLESEIHIPTHIVVMLILLILVANAGITYYVSTNDERD